MFELPENSRELLVDGATIYLQNVAVDNVILGYHEKQLKVLLQRPQTFSKWMLAGGFIKKTESVESAAARVAEERTGLKEMCLQQFKVFSKPGRNNDGVITAEFLHQVSGLDIKDDHWLLQPFISIGFYILIDYTKVETNGNFWMEECKWWDIAGLPNLIHDHYEIIQQALKTLRTQIGHLPIGYHLLPEKFTLPEIRTLYETILGRQLDDRNFSKKLLARGIIEKLHEVKKIKGHRPPFLYRFNQDAYLDALQAGIVIS
jgi:8-oxo-dGTP diphosphatase